MYLRYLDNLTAEKDGGTGEGGVLVTQERMTDSDAAKVDANVKADAPKGYVSSNSYNIDTPKIDVKRGIGKLQDFATSLSWRMSLRQKSLYGAQSDGEGAGTGKFDAKKEAEREAKKSDAKTKSRRDIKR